MSIGMRIKQAREAKNIKQREFASAIKIGQSTLAMFENGQREPKDIHVNMICSAYHVNETWLRTGEGEMFFDVSIDEEISSFIGKIQMDDKNNFKKRFIAMLSKLNESEWEFLEQKAKEIVGYDKKMD